MESGVDGLSDKQREILKQFKSSVFDILRPDYTDEVLLKYLRAKNFNLESTIQNFREIHWTSLTYDLVDIVNTYKFKDVFKYQADTFLGFAKDGSPIRYITGTCDSTGFLHSVPTYELIRYFVFTFEKDIQAMNEENIRTGRKNTEIMYIVDLEELTLGQLTNKCMVEIGLDYLRLMQDFYPERWRSVIFINAPYLFDKIFQLFTPIMRDSLVKKIKFISKENTIGYLRQNIDDEVLPAFLGGKRVDSNGDIYCREFINQGGLIPEKFYLKNCTHYIDETDPGVQVMIVGARTVFNIPFVVREQGSIMRLEFRTENGSIGLVILFRDFGPDPDHPDIPESDEYLDPHDESSNVIEVGTRIKCHSQWAPNDGRAFAFRPGIFIAHFDNTGSWFTSRKLFYRCNIYPPGTKI